MRRLLYVIPFVLITLCWYAYQYWLPLISSKLDAASKLAVLGTFGDSFGALNTLFSGLAFAAISLSLYLQAQEIKETRKEVAAQQEQQVQQVFESSFFQLLQLSNEIVKGVQYIGVQRSGPTRNTSGKESFDAIREDIASLALTNNNYGRNTVERYEYFYINNVHDELGHFFRNLYQIVKFVHSSPVKDKKFYTNIVRAQLSSNQLFLLFYNGLSKFGREKFFPLLQEYEFFEHLPAGGVFTHDAEEYGLKAFGSSLEWKERLARKIT